MCKAALKDVGTRGSGLVEESGTLQHTGQGCVGHSRGLEDPNVPLSAPTSVQLAPTSPKLVEEEFSEVGVASVPWHWLTPT
jgi:hypothetical protein